MKISKPVKVFTIVGICLITVTAIAGDKFKYDIEQDDDLLRMYGFNSIHEPESSRLGVIWEMFE